MRIELRAVALMCGLATSCGGRTDPYPTLWVGETDPDSDSGVQPQPKDPSDPKPDRNDPDPSDPDPNDPDPSDPKPDPNDPDPSDPDPAISNPNCTAHNAKGGMACFEPCVTTCGFYDIGTKACDCVSGVFVSCHCPRPWDYQGHTTAPACATVDGRTHWLDNTACAEEWAQCIGSDPVAGTNPRGCVCLTDPVSGRLEWTCGSTNKWFLAE